MKKILILVMVMFLAFITNAQELTLYLEENFENNTHEWSVSDNDDASSSIHDGYYFIQNKSGGTYRFWNSFKIDANNDFTVEVKIRQVSGDPDEGYGMFFTSEGVDENYNFEVKDGYYKTTNKIGGDYDQNKWTATKYVNTKSQYNVLKVKKTKDFVYYYINDNIVNVLKYKGTLGDDFGFVMRGQINAQVDYLKIWSVKPKINLVDNPINNPVENLGDGVNTSYSELIPVISPDGKTLFFCRDSYPGNVGEDKDNNDIYYSTFNGKSWSSSKNIGKPLNNNGHNYVITATPDNNTLILNGTYTAFGETDKNGISVSFKNPDGSWSIPKTIVIKNFKNDDKYQNFTLSNDLQVIIIGMEITSDTKGQSDLYVSFKNTDGTYTTPKNLGSVINTTGEEGTPFLAPDNQTLYFYSDGHPGYGNADIFVSKRLDNTWTNWSKPMNLGSNINSAKWDAYFTVDAKGEYAYFVSSSNSKGEEDIFRVKLQNEIKPQPVVLIKGKVYDKKTNKPLSAKIYYDDLTGNVPFDIATSNPKSGEYQIILPTGKKFGFYAQKAGYIAVSDNIDLTAITEYKEIIRDLYLVPLEQNGQIVLNNIFFDKGKADLLSSSYAELDRMVDLMNQNPTLVIEVQGYTNNIGDKQKLIELSQKRTEAVKKYLVSKGINVTRIQTKGFGPDNPIASNSTEDGRAKNQRVEFKIIKK